MNSAVLLKWYGLTGSFGRSSISFSSKPSRSRTVFSYSKFVRRRARGVCAGLALTASRRANSIHRTTATRSLSLGRGSPSGGISPFSSRSRIDSHNSRSLSLERSPPIVCSPRSAFCFLGPWHLTQCAVKRLQLCEALWSGGDLNGRCWLTEIRQRDYRQTNRPAKSPKSGHLIHDFASLRQGTV